MKYNHTKNKIEPYQKLFAGVITSVIFDHVIKEF